MSSLARALSRPRLSVLPLSSLSSKKKKKQEQQQEQQEQQQQSDPSKEDTRVWHVYSPKSHRVHFSLSQSILPSEQELSEQHTKLSESLVELSTEDQQLYGLMGLPTSFSSKPTVSVTHGETGKKKRKRSRRGKKKAKKAKKDPSNSISVADIAREEEQEQEEQEEQEDEDGPPEVQAIVTEKNPDATKQGRRRTPREGGEGGDLQEEDVREIEGNGGPQVKTVSEQERRKLMSRYLDSWSTLLPVVAKTDPPPPLFVVDCRVFQDLWGLISGLTRRRMARTLIMRRMRRTTLKGLRIPPRFQESWNRCTIMRNSMVVVVVVVGMGCHLCIPGSIRC